MPFHPCGSKWDWLRFPYKSLMRLGPGMPPIEVRWIRADPKAPIGSPGHGFTSRIWENDWRIRADAGEVGELYGQGLKWYDGLPNITGQCHLGPTWPEAYRTGVPVGEQGSFPALRLDAQGFPFGCCSLATYYDLYRRCEGVYRWPNKVRLRGVNNSAPGFCPTMVSSDIGMSLNLDGFYEGIGFWEPGHIPVRATMGSPEFPFLPCSFRFDFLDHPGRGVVFQLALTVAEARWLTDGYGVRVLGPTLPFGPGGYNPCGPDPIINAQEWDVIADLSG